MIRIAVFVSGGGTNLQALLDAEREGGIPHGKISLVLSSKPGVYALERAAVAGVRTAVVERKAYTSLDSFDADIFEQLEAHSIDLIVLAGFLSMVGPRVMHRYEGRVINVHPALIPAFSGKGFYGLRPHEAALERGVKLTGATVHLCNDRYDEGEILLQKAVEVLPGDTPETLQRRVMEQAEWILLPQATEMMCERLGAEKQKA